MLFRSGNHFIIMIRIPFDVETFGELEAGAPVELMSTGVLSDDGQFIVIQDVEGIEPEYVEDGEEEAEIDEAEAEGMAEGEAMSDADMMNMLQGAM